jgi:uncharacterized protein YaiI (UPF0178 family)
MKILVDADACPVKKIIVSVAKEFGVPVTMICDTCHQIVDEYSSVINVDKSSNSADIALINLVNKRDIVISGDYGVAAMALSKDAYAVDNSGFIYTNDNIERLLFERHIGQKARKRGLRTGNIKKRCNQDDMNFEKALRLLVSKGI